MQESKIWIKQKYYENNVHYQKTYKETCHLFQIWEVISFSNFIKDN